MPKNYTPQKNLLKNRYIGLANIICLKNIYGNNEKITLFKEKNIWTVFIIANNKITKLERKITTGKMLFTYGYYMLTSKF